MEKLKINVGDIIFKPFIKNGDRVLEKNAFIVSSIKNKIVTAIDHRSIFATFAISDLKSTYTDGKISPFIQSHLPKEYKRYEKTGIFIMEIDVIKLLADDISKKDIVGEVNSDIVKRALVAASSLENKNFAKYITTDLTISS